MESGSVTSPRIMKKINNVYIENFQLVIIPVETVFSHSLSREETDCCREKPSEVCIFTE